MRHENISEIANANYDAISVKTATATEMALSAHNLSADAKYARRKDGTLWIWSDRREAWVQIDFGESIERQCPECKGVNGHRDPFCSRLNLRGVK